MYVLNVCIWIYVYLNSNTVLMLILKFMVYDFIVKIFIKFMHADLYRIEINIILLLLLLNLCRNLAKVNLCLYVDRKHAEEISQFKWTLKHYKRYNTCLSLQLFPSNN